MKIERTRNATRNIFFGITERLYQILVPFLMRTIMIHYLGVEYLGLSSLFSSVLQVLNLAELGVGSAMVFSMYKPIAEDDKKSICALLSLYRFYYRIIGTVIAVFGLTLTPFIRNLISGGVPEEINIYYLYLLNLAATVASYWMFAYKNSLLLAHQRTDISSIIKIIIDTIQYVGQFIALIIYKNYYLFLICTLVSQILTNITVAFIVSKKYPDYRPIGRLSRGKISEINHRIKDLFYSKIGNVVINSADTIVISSFLGLSVLAIYQNYYLILKSIQHFLGIVLSSCTAGIGNSLIIESKRKNLDDFYKFSFIINWIAGFCTCCLLSLYQPFMVVWMGNELLLKYSAVVCFALYFYVYVMNALFVTYKDAAGIWHQDRFRPLIIAGVNLLLNIILVRLWNIYGVLLATFISMSFIGIPWVISNIFSCIFDKKDLKNYLIYLLKLFFASFLVCIVTSLVTNIITLSPVMSLISRTLLCLILPNCIYYILFRKTKEFHGMISLIKRILKK